jgi:glyoxylase-like metal-dependent hydrolase (beta-lactamase superfamily II)
MAMSIQESLSSSFHAISRRTALGRIGALGGALLTWNLVSDFSAQTYSGPDMIAQMRKTLAAVPPVSAKLTDTIHMISGPGGNIAVFSWSEGKLAIDSGVLGASDAILAQIDSYGPQPLRILVNTHWHYDHTEGNEAFRKKGALIVAHENVRKRMGAAQRIDYFHAQIAPSPAGALPESTFPTETKLNLGGEQIHITHVPPAHTDGDSFIHFVNANVIHGGDLLFSGFYPFIDYSTGGMIAGMVAGANRILALTDSQTQIIPGHGPLMTTEQLKQYRDMITEVEARVRTLKQQGKDLAGAIAAKPTQKFDAQWGKGVFHPEDFTKIVYSSL